MPIRKRRGKPEASVRGPGRQDGRGRFRQERRERLVVAQRPARLREEIEDRAPAARYADEVAVESARAACGPDIDRRNALSTSRTDDDGIRVDRQSRRACASWKAACDLRSGSGID